MLLLDYESVWVLSKNTSLFLIIIPIKIIKGRLFAIILLSVAKLFHNYHPNQDLEDLIPYLSLEMIIYKCHHLNPFIYISFKYTHLLSELLLSLSTKHLITIPVAHIHFTSGWEYADNSRKTSLASI